MLCVCVYNTLTSLPPPLQLSSALLFDAVYTVVAAVQELNRSQNVGATQLSCKSSKIWEHGTSLMNYLRMVRRGRMTWGQRADPAYFYSGAHWCLPSYSALPVMVFLYNGKASYLAYCSREPARFVRRRFIQFEGLGHIIYIRAAWGSFWEFCFDNTPLWTKSTGLYLFFFLVF